MAPRARWKSSPPCILHVPAHWERCFFVTFQWMCQGLGIKACSMYIQGLLWDGVGALAQGRDVVEEHVSWLAAWCRADHIT